jgi:endonuclease YncB( thermonuclease family)
MRLVTFSFTLPSDPEALKKYAEKAKSWSDVLLSEPNVTELRVYRSPSGKDALAVIRVQSLAGIEELFAAEKFQALRRALENAGCNNFKLGLWEASPMMPEPIRRAM